MNISDPQCWALRHEGVGKDGRQATMKSIGDIFRDNELYCIQENNDRINGWANMKEYMYCDANLKPKFYIFERSVNIIKTLPGLVHSDNIPEDLEKRGAEDHLADAMRYLLMHTFQSYPQEPENCPQTIFEEEIVGEEEIVDWLDGV